MKVSDEPEQVLPSVWILKYVYIVIDLILLEYQLTISTYDFSLVPMIKL